jgi:hypothetical protein
VPIDIDEGRAPILYITYRGQIANAEVQRVVDAVPRWTGRGAPFAIVVNTLEAEPLSAEQRRMLATTLNEDGKAQERTLRACAVILRSAVMRGVLTALTWLSRPTFPIETFATVAEGEAWVRRKLAEATSRRS